MTKIPDLAAVRDWCKSRFQPKGEYLTSVPTATESTAGGVKPDGSTITIDADGTIHAVASEAIVDDVLGGES